MAESETKSTALALQSNDMEKKTKLALPLLVAGLLVALLVLDSLNEVLAQREGGAFWGAFSRGNSSGASMFPSGCAPGYVLRPAGCERLTSGKAKKTRKK